MGDGTGVGDGDYWKLFEHRPLWKCLVDTVDSRQQPTIYDNQPKLNGLSLDMKCFMIYFQLLDKSLGYQFCDALTNFQSCVKQS